MSNPFVEKLNEKHLCTWYVLPFMGLNIDSFNNTNFINAYQVRNSSCIAVEVRDTQQCIQVVSSIHFQKVLKVDGKNYLIFEVPGFWTDDYGLFLEGKYTKMSDEAKYKIREVSGLKYEVPDITGKKMTDAILMALENHPALRNKWSELIGISEHLLPEQLISVPAESSYIIL